MVEKTLPLWSDNTSFEKSCCMEKNKIIVTIQRGPDMFEGWTDDIPGIYGAGESVKDVKEDVLKSILEYKDLNSEENVPDVLKCDYEIEWNFDVQSFLQFYNGIFSKSALEKITGVNQKLLGHYASGLKKPRKAQVQKIDTALQKFLDDMKMVHLI